MIEAALSLNPLLMPSPLLTPSFRMFSAYEECLGFLPSFEAVGVSHHDWARVSLAR